MQHYAFTKRKSESRQFFIVTAQSTDSWQWFCGSYTDVAGVWFWRFINTSLLPFSPFSEVQIIYSIVLVYVKFLPENILRVLEPKLPPRNSTNTLESRH